MISIGTLTNPRMAQAFVDYLHTLRIDAFVVPDRANGDFGICLKSSAGAEQASRAQQELSRFMQEPTHPRYQAASWERQDDPGVRFQYRGESVLRHNFLAHGGWLTLSVLVLCGLVFLLSQIGYDQLLLQLMAYYPRIDQPWRMITPAFLHFSALHIIFNLLWWWYLGGQIEREQGSGRLLLILLFSGILSNTAQFWTSGWNFGGLSGVVYALAGYVWLSGRLNPRGVLQLPNAYMGFMLVWLVIGYADLFGPPMANTAHTVGLISGLLLAPLFTKRAAQR